MTTTKERLAAARAAASDPHRLAELIGIPVDQWVNRCHEVSLALLKTGEFGHGRVARGWADGVLGQHSWIVLGDDVYDARAAVVDATAPAFHNLYIAAKHKGTPILVSGTVTGKTHFPHGIGNLMEAGPPERGREPAVLLTPKTPLSELAYEFLAMLGPLDRKGWANLANGPMEGWPAGEIIAAMDDTDRLRALVPIDILGMLTNRNPNGLYLAEGADVGGQLRMTAKEEQ